MFINREYIQNLLKCAENSTPEEQETVIKKAECGEKLEHSDIAVLLQIKDKDKMDRIFKVAGDIKKKIYGNRIVLFAPLYISNYCVNNCIYCGFQKCNKFPRRKLTYEEIQ